VATVRPAISAVCVSAVTGNIVVAAGAHFAVFSINGDPLARRTVGAGRGSEILALAVTEGPEWRRDECEETFITSHRDGSIRFWRRVRAAAARASRHDDDVTDNANANANDGDGDGDGDDNGGRGGSSSGGGDAGGKSSKHMHRALVRPRDPLRRDFPSGELHAVAEPREASPAHAADPITALTASPDLTRLYVAS
jgi:hypothetical protein